MRVSKDAFFRHVRTACLEHIETFLKDWRDLFKSADKKGYEGYDQYGQQLEEVLRDVKGGVFDESIRCVCVVCTR